MHFLAVYELLSDSLTAIYVELHQCPSHHSILLTEGPIWEIFVKKFWELAILKNELFFKSAILKFFLLHLCEKSSPFIWSNIFFLHYGWFFQNLGKEAVPAFMHTTVAGLFHKRIHEGPQLYCMLYRHSLISAFWISAILDIFLPLSNLDLHDLCFHIFLCVSPH